jgi:hypothetical protein
MRDIMDVPFPRADSKALISFLIFHISIFLSVSPPSAICTTNNTLRLTYLLACLLPPPPISFPQKLSWQKDNMEKTISKIKRWFKDLLDLQPIICGSSQNREPCACSVFQATKRKTSSLCVCVCVSHDSFYHRAASQLGFPRAGSVRVYTGVSGPCS